MRSLHLVALVATLLFPTSAFAGGWTQSEGKSYAKVWGTGIFGSAAFDLDGAIATADSYSLVSLSMYGEYGLRRDFTLVAGMQPLGVASYADQTRGYAGRLFAGFRQRLVSDPLNLALEARFGGAPGFGGERDLALQSEFEFRPSERTWFTEWELQVGVPLWSFGWFTAATGPRWSTSTNLAPALIGFAQLGFGPFAGFVFDAHLSLNHTFQAPEVVNIAGASDTRYLGVGLGVSWWIVDSFAISVAGDGAFYAASNAAAPALQLGVEFRN